MLPRAARKRRSLQDFGRLPAARGFFGKICRNRLHSPTSRPTFQLSAVVFVPRDPRQWQTRREAGTQSYGLLTVRGGTDKAARLPKGWTGPVSTLGFRASARKPGFFFARTDEIPR